MAKSKIIYHFPHISRTITAYPLKNTIKLAILIVITAFLGLNLFTPSPFDFVYDQARLAVITSPQEISPHFSLAQEYLKYGDIQSVERELFLAQELVTRLQSPLAIANGGQVRYPLTANRSVLGASLSPLKILEEIKSEPQKIQNQISYWEKVIFEKPDYRDGYLQLAILNYQIYENQKAKGYLSKAIEIDPNFGPVQEISKIINN
ncbi:MAG: hypothetical protein V1858_00750 [Candidatus Gottesmanbacteria bacterium]